MGGDKNDEMGFHKSGLNCPSSDTNPKTMSANGGDPFYASGWDPLVSMSMNQNFGKFGSSAYPGMGMSGNSHIVQYPSDSSFGELVPKLPCFGSSGFSEMVSSFGLSECGQVSTLGCHPNYSPNKKADNERTSMIGGRPEEDSKEGGSVGASPDGKKRKRTIESNSPFNPNKNIEEEMQKDLSGESNEGPREEDGKKLKTEESTGANLHAKQSGKQTEDNSNSRDGDYIHVRARRGQATNSHSLAERVRREKISERMRLLQELVPGCNKITGKAVMLGEIINYVQSLQQQVEFLSMKLATVNPELSIDLERILSKDILHFGMSSSQAYPHGVFPGIMQGLPSAAVHFPPLPQIALDTDFQNLFQIGFNPNSAIDNLGPNGCLKSEL